MKISKEIALSWNLEIYCQYSKGTFVITPIKGELTLDQWIKKENFDVSMLLKSKEQILVDFYADKAKLTTPHLGIDSTIAHYLS